ATRLLRSIEQRTADVVDQRLDRRDHRFLPIGLADEITQERMAPAGAEDVLVGDDTGPARRRIGDELGDIEDVSDRVPAPDFGFGLRPGQRLPERWHDERARGHAAAPGIVFSHVVRTTRASCSVWWWSSRAPASVPELIPASAKCAENS